MKEPCGSAKDVGLRRQPILYLYYPILYLYINLGGFSRTARVWFPKTQLQRHSCKPKQGCRESSRGICGGKTCRISSRIQWEYSQTLQIDLKIKKCRKTYINKLPIYRPGSHYVWRSPELSLSKPPKRSKWVVVCFKMPTKLIDMHVFSYRKSVNACR